MESMKQRLALRLFVAVTGDPEATWETLADEERGDALEWADAALEELREPSDRVGMALPDGYKAGSHSATQVWQAMIDAARAGK